MLAWLMMSVGMVVARPDGLPWPDSCESMSPGSSYPPQTGPSPFSLSVDDHEITCDGCLYVTIKGEGTEEFAGFMVQARDPTGQAVGYFKQAVDVKLLDCFGKKDSTAITINYLPKEEVIIRWYPDPGYSGTITMFATIAKDYMEQIYWLKMKTEPIKITKSQDWIDLEYFEQQEKLKQKGE